MNCVGVDADGMDVERFKLADQPTCGSSLCDVVGGAAVIADHAEHVGFVLVIAGKAPSSPAISALVA